MITGQHLRYLRKLKDIKQKTIAIALGISQPAYSCLESCTHVAVDKWQSWLSAADLSEEEALRLLKTYPR